MENTNRNAVEKSFGSVLFLVIAIAVSVISAIMLASWIVNPVNGLSLLGFIFSSLSGMFAWFLYGGLFGEGKIKAFRLHFSYCKVVNTIMLVLVCVIGAALLLGCIALSLMGEMIKETLVPKLEEDIKPLLEQAVEYGDKLDEFTMEDVDAILEDAGVSRQELAKYGIEINDVKDVRKAVGKAAKLAAPILKNWDKIIDFLMQNFIKLTLYVAALYVGAIVMLLMIGSAYKNVSRHLKSLAGGKKKGRTPFVVLFIGGTFAALLGCLMFALSMPLVAVANIIEGGVLVMLALFFKQIRLDVEAERALTAAESSMSDEIPVVEAAPAEESIEK